MNVKEYKGFMVGEKVICVLNNRANLTVGNEYTIESIEVQDDDDFGDGAGYKNELMPRNFWIVVKNDFKQSQSYTFKRFMDKNQFRKYTIDQILR